MSLAIRNQVWVRTLQQTGRSCCMEIILNRDPELCIYMDTDLSDMHTVVPPVKRSWKCNRRRRSLFSSCIKNFKCSDCVACPDTVMLMFIELLLANVVSLVLAVMLLSSSVGTDELSSNPTLPSLSHHSIHESVEV